MSALAADAAPARPARGFLARVLREPAALAGGAIVLAFVLMAALAPVLAPHAPNASDWLAVRQPPSAAHWLGTDDLGRDVLSRIVFGARSSIAAGVVAVVVALAIGVPLGLLAGTAGGVVDLVVSRLADAFLAMPFLVLAIALAAFLGPSLENAMIAIGLSATPIFVRLARGQTLAVCAEDYIAAARSQGVGPLPLMIGHILPNILPPVVVQASLTMAVAVLAEASLAFLGLGQVPPDPSWGSMLDVARQFLGEAPWMAIWPGSAIILLVIGFNLLGDGCNDALVPGGRAR